ncbi:maestro heat-like repeat family member 5 [Patagioenas fasciata]|uniref:maestro heat-like repeat family member 5 n=1 Tax=Patagioenas fasciata TaxID=372321 RepID=UPI003A99B573
MAQLEREEASPIAVVLAKLLRPFFDDELSQLRKVSISLFRDLMKMVVENDKRKMKNTVRLGLLPLFFHMSDQVQSVAKVAREALLDAAELLKWKQLRHLVQTQQTWRIGESLLERDRSRAQELLRQSLPYLRDPQASLQEAALRFIAIQPLEEDSDPSISSLATHTIVTVCSSWKRPRSRWSLRALCCWR